MKPVCENCTYWTEEGLDIWNNDTGLGKCRCGKFIYSPDDDEGYDKDSFFAGEADYPTYTQPPLDRFTYWDSEGYAAGFATGRHFGCIHFSERVQS